MNKGRARMLAFALPLAAAGFAVMGLPASAPVSYAQTATTTQGPPATSAAPTPVPFEQLRLDQPGAALGGSWTVTGPPGCGASNPPASEQATATLTAAPDQSGLFSLTWSAGPVQVSLSGPVLVTAQGQLQLDLQSTIAVGTDTATLTGYGTAFSGQAQVGGAGPCGFTGAVQLTLDGTGLTAVCVATVQDASPSLSPAPAVPPAAGGVLGLDWRPALDLPQQAVTGTASSCVNVVVQAKQPFDVDATSGGKLSFSVTIEDHGILSLTQGQLTVTFSPGTVLHKPSQATLTEPSVPTVPGDRKITLHPSSAQVPNPLPVPPGVAADGSLINGMNSVAWSGNPGPESGGTPGQASGWGGTSPAHVVLGGGHLFFSDNPEYIASTTSLVPPKGFVGPPAPEGDVIEGVLYKEPAGTAVTSGGPFRIYFNHENRTGMAKSVCVVVYNPGKGPVSFTQGATGYGGVPNNPVQTGKRALDMWEAQRRAPKPRTTAVKPGAAYAFCLPPIAPHGGVMNAIIDARATGPVNLGTVVVNNHAAFAADPLGYPFADSHHPGGDPARTYLAAGSRLMNVGEHGHSSGTFDYDKETVTLFPASQGYDLDTGARYGALLAGSPTTEAAQYRPAVGTSGVYDVGNYGVLYDVAAQVGGTAGEQAQVLLNPRGVGYSPELGVRNGFAGLADVPAPPAGKTPSGSPIEIPGTGTQNITCSDQAEGIGSAKANSTYTVEFMPPGGATTPVALVLTPAYIKIQAKFTWNGGSQTSDPVFVKLVPKGTVPIRQDC